MAAHERTGWRDADLSEHHRDVFGIDCPAVDIDFLVIEYDRCEPRALVEYKNEHASPIDTGKSPSIKAIRNLADAAGIPAFIVRYTSEFSRWKVRALNEPAAAYLPSDESYMDEIGWVTVLYAVRGRNVPDDVRRKVEEYQLMLDRRYEE
jgi:hypothetical protein